jgi:hypothetical protein
LTHLYSRERSLDITASSADISPLSLEILHKPQKSGGLFQKLQPGTKIRVPPQGKPLYLRMKVERPFPTVKWEDMNLSMFKVRGDKISAPSQGAQTWEFISPNKRLPRPSKYERYYTIKLFSVGDTIFFTSTLPVASEDGRTEEISASCSKIVTTNSGKSSWTTKSTKRRSKKANLDSALDGRDSADEAEPPTEFQHEKREESISIGTNLDVQGEVRAYKCIPPNFIEISLSF